MPCALVVGAHHRTEHECNEMQEHETIIRDVALQGTPVHHSGMPLDGPAGFLHCLCLQVQRALAHIIAIVT